MLSLLVLIATISLPGHSKCVAVSPTTNTIAIVTKNRQRIVTYRDWDRIYYSSPVDTFTHNIVTKNSGTAIRLNRL